MSKLQERYGFLDNKNWQETHSGAGVSNSYLFILVTTGVIGFVLFLNFWIRIFKKLGVNRHSEFMRPVLLSSLVGVFTHAFFENTLFYPFIMIWIFILLGVYFQEKI
ncbi:hypothetical protein M1307_00925 [Patescibacteria group bacterium]|nr:hypothetical protein [Patescibacteria group bacterium]